MTRLSSPEAGVGGAIWSAGLHSLFPEYIDPPSLKSVAIDFATGGVLRVGGPVLKEIIPRAIWNSAASGVSEVSEGLSRAVSRGAWRLWRPFGSEALLVRKYGLTAVKRWGWDARTYGWKRTQYWRLSGGAAGKDLHHWILPNAASRAPLPGILRGLRQAGINHLETPLALNRWMGANPSREAAFRNTGLGVLGASGLTASMITNDLLPKVGGERAAWFLPSFHGLLTPTPIPTGDGTSKNK